MSGDSSSLAVAIGSNVYTALQSANVAQAQFSVNQNAAIAQAEADARAVLGAAEAQAITFERQAAVADFRAAQLAQQARLTRARTALRLAQEGRAGRRRQGTRRAVLSGRGITLRGSPTEVLADAAAEEALALSILEFEGTSRAQALEQGATLRGFEAGQLRREAGIVRSLATQRASFIRNNATVGLSQPSGLSFGDIGAIAGLSVLPGIADRIGEQIADGPDTSFSPGVDLVPRNLGRRRSNISPILLP